MYKKLNKSFVKYMLKNIDTIEKMQEFCESKKTICVNNKSMVCKKILELSGYTNLDNCNYCKIYKELAELVKHMDKQDLSTTSYIAMTDTLHERVIKWGSVHLYQFLNQNGFISNEELEKKETYVNKSARQAYMDSFKDVPTIIVRTK